MDTTLKLVEESRRGSLEAFSGLVRLHHARIRAFFSQYIRRWDRVDDLAQETFLGAYENLRTFAGTVPFGIWLMGIARNKLLMHLREMRQQPLLESDSWLTGGWIERLQADPRASDRLDPEIDALRECIKSLPPTSAKIVDEHYFKGRRIVDMAPEQQKGERALGMTLLRIRQSLRRCVRTKIAAAGIST